MKIKRTTILLGTLVLGVAALTSTAPGAEGLDPALQAKIDAQIKQIQAWASDAVIVKAVKAQNASLAPEYAGMTQDKWKSLTVLDPLVRALSKNDVGQFLKSKQVGAVSEAFVSDAAGQKVGLLSKTTSWSHKGKPKHEVPMTGKTWQGAIEVDESTGLQQIQVAVPVLDGDKPIGSLVVGLSISKLGQE
jgi:hypothetical protein